MKVRNSNNSLNLIQKNKMGSISNKSVVRNKEWIRIMNSVNNRK